MNDYFKTNEALWDVRTDLHKDSEFYNVERFLRTKNSLTSLEHKALSPIAKGQKLLHLQCHFGMDTLSLAHLGAEVTGVDISGRAIDLAQELNEKLGLNASFVKSNIYDLKDNLEGAFDIVFTSFGGVCWLPDLNKWADIVNYYLKEGGLFYSAEFHPFLYTFDHDKGNLAYSYFNEEAIVEETQESYTDNSNHNKKMKEVSWIHPIQDIIMSLIDQGLRLEEFKEYDYSPYDCFPNMVKRDEGEYVFNKVNVSIPHMYSIKARK